MTPTPAQKRVGQRVRMNTLTLKLQSVREERDTLIRQMSADGWSLREIAATTDLSHAGVKKIIER